MRFERFQRKQHHHGKNIIAVEYDRLTTRLSISCNGDKLLSKYIFLPYMTTSIVLAGERFSVRIFWFILWGAKLIDEKGCLVIDELLPERRRKSIGHCCYLGLITSIKLALVYIASTQ
ncbi:hypothetical protein [Shewanella waksmanii]|uniref:hypothetical protein n=1 Tax=Shewanella waksmanii TaxID=213783 RepID=UPI003737093F